MSRPFCANTRCFMHALEVEDHVERHPIKLPSGAVRTMTRGWLVVKKAGWKYPLCDTCSNVIAIIQGEGEDLPASFGMKIQATKFDPDGKAVDSHIIDISEPEIIQ